MTGFEPGSSGIGSDRSANSATTSTYLLPFICASLQVNYNYLKLKNGFAESQKFKLKRDAFLRFSFVRLCHIGLKKA